MNNVTGKKIVLPGDLVGEGSEYLLGEGAFREGDKIYSSVVGLLDAKGKFIRVIPLSGKYIPKTGDFVIGIIKETSFSSWTVELNSPYDGILPVSQATMRFIDLNSEDISRIYDTGDVIFAQIVNVSSVNQVGLTTKEQGLKKLEGGQLVYITPAKVPRLIGRQGTMINMIKDKTKCYIRVGQNGRAWVQGDNEDLAIRAIKQVEAEAHTTGLTDKIKSMLESDTHGR